MQIEVFYSIRIHLKFFVSTVAKHFLARNIEICLDFVKLLSRVNKSNKLSPKLETNLKQKLILFMRMQIIHEKASVIEAESFPENCLCKVGKCLKFEKHVLLLRTKLSVKVFQGNVLETLCGNAFRKQNFIFSTYLNISLKLSVLASVMGQVVESFWKRAKVSRLNKLGLSSFES